jgi:hypothetical protein
VTDIESQVVLNTLIEHNFQDALKKLEEMLGMVHMHRRDYLEGEGGQWAQECFYWVAAAFSEILDSSGTHKQNIFSNLTTPTS